MTAENRRKVMTLGSENSSPADFGLLRLHVEAHHCSHSQLLLFVTQRNPVVTTPADMLQVSTLIHVSLLFSSG